ncbi:nitrate- and nitrite sensing domain-containing protein [Enterobacter kobei]|uniref:Nitrate- and nitrite sensing domain-containing protein n=1 Tax=Enterobacter kobei TaxID=208224 RepID=A0AAW3XFB0_9ENTR|nr:nitrate regulatory protein NasR [Enterobacter kobei]KJM92284.1 nitrate regulatory protein [Enterobacter kobei]MBC6323024.1 nitrate- and nitrite sensing domain-containing protein [Enterobacter kobei]MBG0683331.1 nitrate- and nitrite sensing domain-containing protein [Enterobacter kobei]MBW4188966.1 nitrate- and nitrite sensing domain-containing protein [Enterobacter kobei]MCU2430920.1 nitrate regulatory protein NasR [Enterobacter kobei]
MTLMAGISPGATEWLQRARLMRREQLSKLAELNVLVHGISQLVHMLQCERGASNVWLCSQGKLYAPECKASRALVDENLAALNTILGKQSLLPGSAVCERIGNALHTLDTLPALRDGVSQQTLTAPQAMEHYSRMLRHLLSIVPQLNDSIDDPQIAGRCVALYSLMQGKELAGQERALGAIGFTQGFFDDVTRQRLVDRIDGQQACFEIFLSHSQADVQTTFSLNCQPDRETEQLRRVACTRQPAADNGHTALAWFALQTARLEHLRALEETIIADLMVAVDERIQRDEVYPHPADELEDPLAHYPDKPLLPLVRQQAREIEQLSRQLASLRDTLEERKTIDKAKSVLMTHQNMSEEQAWTTLRKMAMDKNQRMVDIARALLTVKSVWQITPKE